MKSKELFDLGNLQESITEQSSEVRSHPTDVDARGFLCELLCFAGELERADKQLEAMSLQAPDSILGISMFRQLLRGEMARRDFFMDGRLPEFLADPPDHVRDLMRASIALREGDAEGAAKLAQQAEENRPQLTGECDGVAFDDFRDASDLTAGFFEVITSNGKYYWIPMERVESMEFHAPLRPRDLLWRRVRMIVTDGPDGEVFLPTIYADRGTGHDDEMRLGRSTDWIEQGEGFVEGVGLRTFLIGENAPSIMETNNIEFSKSN